MLALTEAEVAAIQAAFNEGGDEAAAAEELCRLFPAFADRADAQAFAVGIAGWTPIAVPVVPDRGPKAPRRGR
jgi:hypothetical protein